VFNLEECMNNEFLRPRENRCKWFNDFGVMRIKQYIGEGRKAKFSQKNNCLNRFTYWLNRFKPCKKVICVKWKWDDSNSPEDVWYDSNYVKEFDESFQTKMIRFMYESIHYIVDMIHTKSESILFVPRARWIDSTFVWYDSFVGREQL